jgi:16S rRNA (guanine527-N7)-methyltransferase
MTSDARVPLPSDPWTLDPLGPAFEEALDAGLAALGLELDAVPRRAIEAHIRLLLAWTGAINLTAIRTPDRAARLHVVDSLSALALVHRMAPPGRTVLDLGSGGGLPGLPLGIAAGAQRVALVDSIAKKVRFLSIAAAACQAVLAEAGGTSPAIEAVLGRAETLGRDPAHHGRWDVVTVRAVGPLGRLGELGLPFLAPAGLLVCWKRDDGSGSLAGEVLDASSAIRRAGGRPAEIVDDPEPALPGHRLVVVRRRGG